MSIRLSATSADRIRALGEAGFPHEVCGLLLGHHEPDGSRRVVEVYPLENERTDSRENRYMVSGLSMLKAEKYARAAALDVVGYFHSHPNAPARPSGYDLEHATWPNISYPIVSIVDGRSQDLRSWELDGDRSAFLPEAIIEEASA